MILSAPPPFAHAYKPQRQDVLYANEFGMAADGTDQTVPLTRALTAASSAGKTLVIPPGTYHALDVPVPANVSMVGFGARTTLRRPATGTGGLSNVLRIIGSNVTISDLTIDGNRAGLAQADGRGVIDGFTAGADNIVIERCTITEGAESGIRYVNHGTGLVIRDCRITNIDNAATFIQQTTQDGAVVLITGNRVDGCANGIMIRGSNDGTTWFQREVTISHNEVRNVAGLCIESWCADATIIGNVTVGGAFGISNGPGDGTTIVGNAVRGATSIGIEAAAAVNSHRATCIGNRVDGAGISASNTADRVVICDNQITCPTGQIPIHTINVSRVIISGNLIDADTGCAYSIRCQSGFTATVNNNQIDHGTPNGGIGDNGIFFGDLEEFTCVGNAVKNHTFGIRLVSSSATYDGTVAGNLLTGNTDPYDAALSGTATATGVTFSGNRPVVP